MTRAINPFDSVAPASAAAASHIQYLRAPPSVASRCAITNALKPSARGELEITDVNNAYIQQGSMTAEVLQGWWTDAGTFESLYRATKLVVEAGANKMKL